MVLILRNKRFDVTLFLSDYQLKTSALPPLVGLPVTFIQRVSREFPEKRLVHLVYRPVLPGIISMSTIHLALAGLMLALFLK